MSTLSTDATEMRRLIITTQGKILECLQVMEGASMDPANPEIMKAELARLRDLLHSLWLAYGAAVRGTRVPH